MREKLEKLNNLYSNQECCLYAIQDKKNTSTERFVFTSPWSQNVCNDSTLFGTKYTNALRTTCTELIKALRGSDLLFGTEHSTTVFNILRGGLNYELRGALADALGWWRHGSIFISAQRQSDPKDPSSWSITESSYRKTELPPKADIICADVVATGTRLRHAFSVIKDAAIEQSAEINSITFITIGAPQTEDILEELDRDFKNTFKNYRGTSLIYLEGRFLCATPKVKLSIKIDWTDLLRCQSILAPEFIESQYQNPAYPIERCTIYDAGSRAYHLPEYIDDVTGYWHQVLTLATNGISYQELLAERFPELESSRFNTADLKQICNERLARLKEQTST